MNYVKWYNNWNMCCNHGFDVEGWHTSATCPNKADYPHHNDNINRKNAQQWKDAGWKVCFVASHKNKLPTNPGPDQM